MPVRHLALNRVRQQFELTRLMEEIAQYYNVPHCAVALKCRDGNERTEFIAMHGVTAEAEAALCRHCAEEADPGSLKFFHHHLKRDLPIIIQNVNEVNMLRDHPLVVGTPHIQFYVAAPITKGEEFIGTLSIFDVSTRSDFAIQDCEMLQKAATEAAKILQDAV